MSTDPRTTSRRRFLLGGLGGAALVGLAACGSTDSGATATTSAASPTPSSAGAGSSTPTAAPSTAATTRAVSSVKGTVQVPVDPQRIVSIQPSTAATLWDLDVNPVGVYDLGAQYVPPRYRTAFGGATKIGSNGEIDVEKVAALKPDLIVGVDYEWNTKSYDQLKAVAPTVIVPSDTWQNTSKITADSVGKSIELDALATKVTDRTAEIRSTYAATLAKYRWDLLQGGFDDGQFWVYGTGIDVGAILTAAGLQLATASSKAPKDDVGKISYENIDQLSDADVIGFYADWDGKPVEQGAQLFTQKLWAALPAVQAKRTVPLADFLPGGYGDVLALLDEFEAGLQQLGG
jgi:iron complex transport system substrate-binding protein